MLLKSLVALLKPKKNTTDMRFLCVSTTALGDTLWATPAIKALRETYPQSYIAVLTSSLGREVLWNNPHIDELFIVKNSALSSLCFLYGVLKRRYFSHAFIFHTSQRPVLPCAALLGASMIIGSSGINKGLDCLLTNSLKTEDKTHEIQRRLNIVAQVDAHASSKELELFLNEEDEEIAKNWLLSLSLPDYVPFIAFHPGAKDSFKMWPASHFIELGKRLVAHFGCALFITGTSSEKALVETIASSIEGSIPVTHLPLRSFAAFIKTMNLIVTNDTGPMHIACAMKTPTVALFAPTDPQLCGPYSVHKVKILAKPPSCSPCLKRKCPSAFCLLQIGVQEVYDAALTLFYEGKCEARI